MIWKVIRQSLKRSIYEYMIYFFTLGIGVVAFYSYAVLLDKHFRTDMGLSASFSVLSDKVLYAAPFIFLMPTMLIIYIERFLYIRKQKELAILIASGLRQSKAAYIYCIERMVVALLGISTGMISGGMVSSLVLYRHFVYIGEKLVIKPLFYPFTILLTYGYFMLVIVVLSFYYGRKIMKSAVVDLLRTTEDNKPEKNAGGRSGIFALAAGYTCFVYVSGIIICIMLVCFDYFPMIYRLLSIVCVVMPVLLLGIFIKNRDRYYNTMAVICLGVVEDGVLCVLYPLLDRLVKAKCLDPQLCYLLVLGMIFMLFSIIFHFYEIFSELLLKKRYGDNRKFSENRVILGDICNNIHIYGKVMSAITLVMIFILVIGIWTPIYLERIEGYLHERTIFDMQLFTMISYDKYTNHESSAIINSEPVKERLEKAGIMIDDEITLETFFVEEQLEKGKGSRLATCVSLSDYNNLLLSLEKEPVVLTGEYAIQWDQQYSEEQMAEAFDGVLSIIAGDITLWDTNASNYVYETGMALFTNHTKYVYVVQDDLCRKLNRATSIALYHFDSDVSYETAIEAEREMNCLFENMDSKVYVRLKTLQETETMAVVTLIRMIVGYMETILILGCLAMLSVQQLTNILQSRRKYKILYFLGFTNYRIKRLVFKNEMAWFLMPVVSAAIIALGGVAFSFAFFLNEFLFYCSKNQIFTYIVESYAKIAGFSFLYISMTWFITRKFISTNI